MKNLNKLYWLKKEVTQIEEQIRELTILSAFEMSGMPSSNSVSSPVEKFYARLDKLRTKLDRAKEKAEAEKERLESFIDGIDDEELKTKYRQYPWLEFQDCEEAGYIQKYAERVAPEFIKLYLEEFKNG